jgi:hypothetical protein
MARALLEGRRWPRCFDSTLPQHSHILVGLLASLGSCRALALDKSDLTARSLTGSSEVADADVHTTRHSIQRSLRRLVFFIEMGSCWLKED